jgi:hypothetical protein
VALGKNAPVIRPRICEGLEFLGIELNETRNARNALLISPDVASLVGRYPIAVTYQATTLDQAVDGAADKLFNLIGSTLERRHDQELHRTAPPLPEQKPSKPS